MCLKNLLSLNHQNENANKNKHKSIPIDVYTIAEDNTNSGACKFKAIFVQSSPLSSFPTSIEFDLPMIQPL